MDEEVTVPIQLRAAREAFSTWDGFLAFGFGFGLVPRAPGTAGTLIAVPFAWLLKGFGTLGHLVVVALLFYLGVHVCNRVGRRLGVDDYGGIVFDEMVGYWLAVALLPASWAWLLAAFVVFRLLDITKPWPIDWLETRLTGGLGVMADDVLAAVYTMILVGGVYRMLFG